MMVKLSEKYRLKAIACERFAREATDPAIKTAWSEIAIEWHTIAHQIAQTVHNREVGE